MLILYYIQLPDGVCATGSKEKKKPKKAAPKSVPVKAAAPPKKP
jgi:hypothetical protein